MKLVFLFCIVAVVAKNNDNTKDCEGILVHEKFHKKVFLGKGLNRPYQLALAHHDHTVYFSYNVGEDNEDTFKIGFIEKNHTGHKEIADVENGFSIAIDNEEHVAYFGGSEGVYKYQLNEGKAKPRRIIYDYDVWDMFFKNELYFITYPNQRLYKLDVRAKNSKPIHMKHIHEKIYQYAIDKHGDQFITTSEGVHMIKNNTNSRTHLEGVQVLRAIEISKKGEAYFCGQNGIFIVNKQKKILEEIAHIKNIFGLAFDHEDNIIYSDPHEIVKLLPEECE